MEKREKTQITSGLKALVSRIGSQSKAATLLGIGKSTVSVMLSGDPKGEVSDEMWRTVAALVRSGETGGEWQVVETGVLAEIERVMQDAQADAGCTWIVAEAGSGKSTAARYYAESYPRVHYVLCSDMVRGDFLKEIGRVLGLRLEGGSLKSMLSDIVGKLLSEDRPLLVFDEADKLSDGVFNYFVQLYNLLEDRCGLVFLSTSGIEFRMARGLEYRKRGYAEFNSRIGRRFFKTEPVSSNDVASICAGNGITDDATLRGIVEEAARYDNDLRRVKKLIKAHRA